MVVLEEPVRTQRIVLVEDNLDQLHSFAYLLKQMGHQVDYAINGYVAMEVVRRFKPDTVVIDLQLPGINGFDVARQIRKDPDFARIKLIAHTAFDTDDDRRRARVIGFDEYYPKPLDPSMLHQIFGGHPPPPRRKA